MIDDRRVVLDLLLIVAFSVGLASAMTAFGLLVINARSLRPGSPHPPAS